MKRKKISLFDTCNTIILVLVLIITVYPMYYTVIASFSDPAAVAGGKITWKPVGFTPDAYKQVFAYTQIWVGYANTIFYTVLGTLFNLVLTIPTAYALSKKYLPHKKFLMGFFLFTMYFGGGLVPSYLLYKGFGLLNTRMIMVICGGISIYNVIVTRTYFATSISDTLYEAADIDGAGELKKFFAIAMPLAKPITAVMVLYYAVGHWNDYFTALLYITDKKLEPLQLVLRRVLILNENALNEAVLRGSVDSMSMDQIVDSVQRANAAYAMKYAMVFIGSAPLLIAYPFVQKHFVKGVMIGAVKE